jgi:hypothetical protein
MRHLHGLWMSGLSVALTLAACGGGGGGNTSDGPLADAMPSNTGFELPTKSTHANMEGATANTWTDLGPADWSCLGTPSPDKALTADLTLSVTIHDFQTPAKLVAGATVDAFAGIDYAHPFKTSTTDAQGAFTLTVPAGQTRVGFKMHATDYMDTFLLNQYWDGTMATESLAIGDISKSTANTLPAFIDLDRVIGTGVLAGAMRDCAHHEVSNAIATVSSTPTTVTHLTGTVGGVPVVALTYYFNASVGLPAKHTGTSGKVATDPDGLFSIFDLPPTEMAYIQVWGFKSDADIAKGKDGLSLLAELPSPVVAENVITGSIEPLRTK